MPYDNKLPRVLISENCISHLKMRVFWLSGPNGWPDKKLKHKGNVAHSTFRGGCVIDLVWKNYSLYVKIAIFSYKLDTLYKYHPRPPAHNHCRGDHWACPQDHRGSHWSKWLSFNSSIQRWERYGSMVQAELRCRKLPIKHVWLC